MKSAKRRCWRSVVAITQHSCNGQGNGGCVVSSKFVRLACGHTMRLDGSRVVYLGQSKICTDCERDARQQPASEGSGG